MDYKDKYLKYKSKYNNLKLNGGSIKLNNILNKYQTIFYRIDLDTIRSKYKIEVKEVKYDNMYLKFIKLRGIDNKIDNKIKNMNQTSLWYMNNNKNLNYKFSICKIIRNIYFKNLEKGDIIIINNKKKIIEKSWCDRYMVDNPEELPVKIKKKDLIIISFRKVEILKKYTGTIYFDYKHVEYYIKLLIWSLKNLKKNGKISFQFGLSMEPAVRDLLILVNHYCESFIFSLNYFYGLDSLSSSIIFYNFRSVDKLINELVYINKIKKRSHSILIKTAESIKVEDKLNKLNIFLINRYINFSKWYDSVSFNEKYQKKIIDFSLNTIIYNSIKPTDNLFNLIKDIKQKVVILPNKDKIKIPYQLSISRGLKLYNFISKNKINSCLQLGINYGNLVLYIISSLKQNNGKITLIVPKQKTEWNNIGINKMKRNKLYKNVNRIFDDETTNVSLSKLINMKNKYDMIYINDWYKSGYSMLNIYYSILLLNKNGYLILDISHKQDEIAIKNNLFGLKNIFGHLVKEINPKKIGLSKTLKVYVKNDNNRKLEGGGNNNYIYVPLIEGLGNKMFIFAAAFSLSKKINSKIIMGLYSSGHDKFGGNSIHYIFPDLRNQDRKLKHYISFLKNVSLNKDIKLFNENDNKEPKGGSILMTGYFQGYYYFKKYINELKLIYNFNNNIIDNIKLKYKDLYNVNKIIAVHVRHGDMYKMMLNSDGYVKHPIMKKEYYIDAFSKIKDISSYKIIYLTDTAQKWISDNLISLYNGSLISENELPDEDLYLMSQSDYLICSNSTLSYWGGILGKNKKVIAPKYYMNIGGNKKLKFDNIEYYPPEWIIIDNLKTSIWKNN